MTGVYSRALATLVLLTVARIASATDLPAELVGDWSVASLAGDQTAHLGLRQPRDIVGKRIEITADTLSLWSEFRGHPGHVSSYVTTLDKVVVTPNEWHPVGDFREAHEQLKFYEIGLTSCSERGRPIEGDCPVVVFAQEPSTGAVSLVPFAYALARMERRPAGYDQRR